MWKFLWLDNSEDVPFEYTLLVLCRDVYHCPPSELMAQDWDIIQQHLKFLEIEGKVQKQKSQK